MTIGEKIVQEWRALGLEAHVAADSALIEMATVAAEVAGATHIPTARLIEMRATLVRDRDIHQANLNGVSGAIQIVDTLLTPVPVQTAADADAVGAGATVVG